MRGPRVIPVGILLCVMMVVSWESGAWSANEAAPGKPSTFFSQGQSVYVAQDRTKSRQEAIHDLLVQAVTQAVGTFLSPSEMGTHFGGIQEQVLKQPERYVETYQIFSEAPMGGLFRVTGQVTVSLEALKKDLLRSGFGAAGPAPTVSPPMQEEVKTTMETPAVSEKEEVKPAKSAREKALSKQKLLWVVAEKWGKEWYLPRDRRDPRGLFALSILQESQDYDWSLVFPGTESVSVDPGGRISQGQAVSLAGTLGTEKVVLGTADLQPRGSRDVSLVVKLRVLDSAGGVSQGEIRKELELGGSSDQQGAMEMAFALVPQLDRLIKESSPSEEPVKRTEEVKESFKGEGEWTLLISSDHHYAYWEDLAKILADRFKSMRVRSIELAGQEAKIHLEGVDGEYLASLQGTQVRDGVRVQVEGLSQETHSLRVSFTQIETRQPERSQ